MGPWLAGARFSLIFNQILIKNLPFLGPGWTGLDFHCFLIKFLLKTYHLRPWLAGARYLAPVLGLSWAILAPSRATRAASWACLGPSCHCLGPFLGLSWAILAPSGATRAYDWPSEPCHGPVLRPPGQEPDGLGHRHDHLRLLQTLKPSFALVKLRFWKSQ